MTGDDGVIDRLENLSSKFVSAWLSTDVSLRGDGLFYGRSGLVMTLGHLAEMPESRSLAQSIATSEVKGILSRVRSQSDWTLSTGLAGIAVAVGTAGVRFRDEGMIGKAHGLLDHAPTGFAPLGQDDRPDRDVTASDPGLGLSMLWARQNIGYEFGLPAAELIADQIVRRVTVLDPTKAHESINSKTCPLGGHLGAGILMAKMAEVDGSERYLVALKRIISDMGRLVGRQQCGEIQGDSGEPDGARKLGWLDGMSGIVYLYGMAYALTGTANDRGTYLESLERLYQGVVWRVREERSGLDGGTYDDLTNLRLDRESVGSGYCGIAKCMLMGYHLLEGRKVGGFPLTCGHLARTLTQRVHRRLVGTVGTGCIDWAFLNGTAGLMSWLVQYDRSRTNRASDEYLPWDHFGRGSGERGDPPNRRYRLPSKTNRSALSERAAARGGMVGGEGQGG